MDYKNRQQTLRHGLSERSLAGLLVTHFPNVRYLSGFTGSAGVLAVSAEGASVLFTDGRYSQQAEEEVHACRVVITKRAALYEAAAWMSKRYRSLAVGIEANHMTVGERGALSKAAPNVRLRPTFDLVESFRAIKDEDELYQISQAVLLASSVFEAIVPEIKPGVAESRIAAEIEYMCRRLGAEGMSFDTLVSSGSRSAMPHGRASEAKLPRKGFVVLDYGVILGGYCSDMTRTVHLGNPDRGSMRIYNAVLAAQAAGIKAVKAGVSTEEVDYATRKVVTKAGFGKYFTHSTGHGVGLEIHELPGIRKASKVTKKRKGGPEPKSSIARLSAGMVITIEPGVYMSGIGGVRIEDMVAVTETGFEVLTPTRKDLIVI